MGFVREQEISIIRLTGGSIDRATGRPTDKVETPGTLCGSIQPITGEDLNKLPDGYRTSDLKVIFTHEPLEEDDKIIYNERTFRVEHEDEWDPGSSTIPHYRYVIKREDLR